MKEELATKNDLKMLKNELETTISKTKNELEKRIDVVEWKTDQVDNKLSIFKEDTGQKLDTIINSIDGLARLITDVKTEQTAFHSAMYRHEDVLENHEVRLGVLEKGK
jgi:archaellum component FlaC